ncbi:MAG: hypothetical protein P8Z00_12615 [Anaerolineales bacterium]
MKGNSGAIDAAGAPTPGYVLEGLRPNFTRGARVERISADIWRLEIPAGPAGRYRLAQLDDYGRLPRRAFRRQPPFEFTMRVRVSEALPPGTWGMGLWNDPFGMAILSGAEVLRLPALPNAAWFFFASPPNYLSLRDDLPAQGGLAATFSAPNLPAPLLLPGALALPLLALPPTTRWLRRLMRRWVCQYATALGIDPTQWHAYRLQWLAQRVRFWVDDSLVLEAVAVPRGPLGLVIWIDNQYAALPPDGRLRFGMLANPQPAWLEVAGLRCSVPA